MVDYQEKVFQRIPPINPIPTKTFYEYARQSLLGEYGSLKNASLQNGAG